MFKPIINREEILEKLANYSPGHNTTIADIRLRKDVEHVVPFYENLSNDIKEKFSEDIILSQYDILTRNVPLEN